MSRDRTPSAYGAPRTDAFRSVLTPVDLTPRSDRVLGRLALLPWAEDARVTLLHVVPANLPARDQRRVERDAKRALDEEARHLRKSLSVRIEPVVEVGAAAERIAARASAVKAELIVMGRGSGRALRDLVLGSTAERVIRQSRLPVLVVRLAPRAPYRRPALALDFDRAAHDVVRLLLRVLPSPRPPVLVVHAFDDPYRSLVYTTLPDDPEEREAELQLEASRALARMLSTSLERAKVLPRDVPAWKPHVRAGSARIVVAKAVAKAETDLLALGTRGHSGLRHVLLGTVAGDVLRTVACDVLVVPPDPERG